MEEILDQCQELLSPSEIPLTSSMRKQLSHYVALVRQWNGFGSLTSGQDAECRLPEHVADSLSLAPHVLGQGGANASLLDIGSGGGFPAIPLRIVLPELRVHLLERSRRKVQVLEHIVGGLHLAGVTIVEGEYPARRPETSPGVITARAVEKPGKVLRAIGKHLAPGAVFLCQSSDPGKILGEMFHVEHVQDAWFTSGLRRGHLYLVRCASFHVEHSAPGSAFSGATSKRRALPKEAPNSPDS